VPAGPPARSNDQTGGSAAFARALDPKARIEGDDLVVDGTRHRLDLTPRDEIRRLLGVKRSRAKAITEDDIRAICLALPETSERVKRRRSGAVAYHFDAGKTMFVKLFEASNLLAPDLDDVVMIRRVPDRAALLATAPERFFMTRHYGDPSVGGPILTRLSENTKADLAELAELIEESWRDVATQRARKARDG
jgi:hypothetical protein